RYCPSGCRKKPYGGGCSC
uniref:U1-poneritoxin-Ae1b n=1 Tax=Anochetus emarginatus TaxID=486636 RepID=PON1B_ANOEM|nr:RecName: Full=U1-poneritoxin-Ae1b; Short=U1-PONTX-Ae1b; AltName: Full=Poneratoxin [Anochetus emarginatus]